MDNAKGREKMSTRTKGQLTLVHSQIYPQKPSKRSDVKLRMLKGGLVEQIYETVGDFGEVRKHVWGSRRTDPSYNK
jgi:hypothetical protein